MSLGYQDLVNFISLTAEVPLGTGGANSATPFQDSDANTILARAIDEAEQRIYTDFGTLLTTRQQNSNNSLTANQRTFTLPSGCMTVESLSVITPASTQPSAGTRNDVEIVSRDTVDMLYPTEASPVGVPKYAGPISDSQWIFGQTPDQAYVVEVTGYFRPAPMSFTNQSTYIGTNYPQLVQAAVMIFWFKYQQRDEDPKIASSWKSEYQDFIKTAVAEEKRRKGETTNASVSSPKPPMPPPSPAAAPPPASE